MVRRFTDSWKQPGRTALAQFEPLWSHSMRTESPDAREYISAKQVMARYGGRSHMWIERKMKEANARGAGEGASCSLEELRKLRAQTGDGTEIWHFHHY